MNEKALRIKKSVENAVMNAIEAKKDHLERFDGFILKCFELMSDPGSRVDDVAVKEIFDKIAKLNEELVPKAVQILKRFRKVLYHQYLAESIVNSSIIILVNGKDKLGFKREYKKIFLHFMEPEKTPGDKLLICLKTLEEIGRAKSKPEIGKDDGYWGQLFFRTPLEFINILQENGFEVSQL